MAANFDKIAPMYDAIATCVFGDLLKKSQKVFLTQIPPFANILIIGGGNGWILTAVHEICCKVRVLYVEASSRMLENAQANFKKLDAEQEIHVEFRMGTEKTLLENESFDVIITPFVLDLYREEVLVNMLRLLSAHLKPEGYFIFSDFHVPINPFSLVHKTLISCMYAFFRITANVKISRLPEFDRAFMSVGFAPIKRKYWAKGLVQAKIYRRKKHSHLKASNS